MPSLVLTGGWDSLETFDSVLQYDPLKKLRQRNQAPQPMTCPREAHGAVRGAS